MRSVERLEEFWRNLVLALPSARAVDGAVVVCYPEVPVYPVNHAVGISVDEGEAEDLLDRITGYFVSRGSSYACFRTSPITRPRWFTSLLQEKGFQRKSEGSVMVFKGRQVKDKLSPDVEVEQISESEIDVYNRILLASFEMPVEWKKGFDKLTHILMRTGWRCCLAYVEGKPVGTSALASYGKTGGIFNVGTLGEYRRRGIGTALTVHALMGSMDEKNELHMLETERGGNAERLYRKVGFRVDHTVSYFVKEFHGKN